jgi:heptosyltransferase-1
LVTLLRRTRLYIGGDTGPTQLAAAIGVPMVALFGPTDPWRNGPLAPDDIIIREDLDCDACKRNRCSRGPQPECMKRITPEIVIRAVKERLGGKT